MHAPDADDLLRAWERCLGTDPTGRALGLLSAACPELGQDELAGMPIGRRDALLLDLRALLFGPELTVVVECPGCGESLESTFPAEQLRAQPDPGGHAVQHVRAGGLDVAFRLPSSSDLLPLSGPDTRSVRGQLLARCVFSARETDGGPVGWEALPDEVVAAVCERMSAADPQADVELALACPLCGNTWAAPFDIAGFLWSELDAWAMRLLRDVHALARAYGWREPDVLALSPIRRGLYLELSRQ